MNIEKNVLYYVFFLELDLNCALIIIDFSFSIYIS